MFEFENDDIPINSIVYKEKILKRYSQEKIFSLVFGFEPKVGQYVTSPFREDRNPGCWFDVYKDKLVFRDFAITNRPINCFSAVGLYYNIEDFNNILKFIDENSNIKPSKIITPYYSPTFKRKVEIFINPRDWDSRDKKFWSQYKISKQNLEDDKVFPNHSYMMKNTKSGDYIKVPKTISYSYTDFDSGNIKIYQPYEERKIKFISNCNQNDIGGINNTPVTDNNLIITKSYKDYRVLKNLSLNVIWTQNEGMIPKNDIMIGLCKRFDRIIVWYDNDKVGIKKSKEFSELINSNFPDKANNYYLPTILNNKGIKDPSDLIKKLGEKELIKIMRQLWTTKQDIN